MKRKSTKGKLIVLSVLAAGLLGWAVYAKFTQPKQTARNDSDSQSQSLDTNQPITGEEPVPEDKLAKLKPEPVQNSNTTLAKPVLSKSSGNNGPVPAGALINFVCEGTAGLNCEIILTNTSGQTINLAQKTLSDNGRGQVFASWDWESVQGSWKVYSKVTDNYGNSASSDIHPLTVQ